MKDIPGFEGLYAITEDGKVWSYPKMAGNSQRRGRFLKLFKNARGYLYVRLSKNNILHPRRIHRLMALTYIPNLENKCCINHINGIKTDNHIENLEWCTTKENVTHAIAIGLRSGKISESDVILLKKEYSEGTQQKILSNKYNISKSLVGLIVNNKRKAPIEVEGH